MVSVLNKMFIKLHKFCETDRLSFQTCACVGRKEEYFEFSVVRKTGSTSLLLLESEVSFKSFPVLYSEGLWHSTV